MSGHLAAGTIAQRVREAFGQRLHGRLAHVVGRVARRLRDPLLRPGVDDQAWLAAVGHCGHERLHTVEHPEEVDAQHARPAVWIRERVAAATDAGVVHQHGDRAKAFGDPGGESVDGCPVADVDDGNVEAGDIRSGIAVGDADAHAQVGEPSCRGQADSTGAAGHDGDFAGRQRGVQRAHPILRYAAGRRRYRTGSRFSPPTKVEMVCSGAPARSIDSRRDSSSRRNARSSMRARCTPRQ